MAAKMVFNIVFTPVDGGVVRGAPMKTVMEPVDFTVGEDFDDFRNRVKEALQSATDIDITIERSVLTFHVKNGKWANGRTPVTGDEDGYKLIQSKLDKGWEKAVILTIRPQS
ncbi:uncharacterized protein JCM15063_005181 [Sporobolomyces koalae]|uniref:uncharacterized protein n=1 Tax=Sporobolomyces koalae TaxID=500713 RepID=UPI00317E8819